MTIVVCAGPAISGGLSEPSALTTKFAGRTAVAEPFVDGIEPVVDVGLGVAVVDVVSAVEDVLLLELFLCEPHPAASRITAITPRTSALRRLIRATITRRYVLWRGVQMGLRSRRPPARLFEYDALHRRLWIRGQRCHHGATGTLVALVATVGLIATSVPEPKPTSEARPLVALVLAGGALMAHDWKDRSVWFQRGRGPRR